MSNRPIIFVHISFSACKSARSLASNSWRLGSTGPEQLREGTLFLAAGISLAGMPTKTTRLSWLGTADFGR
ncbi:hypothetical protein K449DRAFT_83708 [Hypoxylon sp. EC38]|nr:hypothetical protein K449DRAFT_83708 [Hypoxylon sp. EC38]